MASEDKEKAEEGHSEAQKKLGAIKSRTGALKTKFPRKMAQILTTATPRLDCGWKLDKSSRLILMELGFAYSLNECPQRTLRNLSDFRPPELLIGVLATHKVDIFSLGLLFWEDVMLRQLVET